MDFEPGPPPPEFSARHMMVTYVRGHFKDVHGSLNFDPKDPAASSVEITIEARKLWTGEPMRDDSLAQRRLSRRRELSEIIFRGQEIVVIGEVDYRVRGELTIRGKTNPVTLDVHYLGQWQTPWWEDGVDKGPRTRAGFVAKNLD